MDFIQLIISKNNVIQVRTDKIVKVELDTTGNTYSLKVTIDNVREVIDMHYPNKEYAEKSYNALMGVLIKYNPNEAITKTKQKQPKHYGNNEIRTT